MAGTGQSRRNEGQHPVVRPLVPGSSRREFYDAIAKGGWLGITIPEEYGGHGLGITEATLLAEEVSRSEAAMNGASAIHLSIFGMQPVVKHMCFGTSASRG